MLKSTCCRHVRLLTGILFVFPFSRVWFPAPNWTQSWAGEMCVTSGQTFWGQRHFPRVLFPPPQCLATVRTLPWLLSSSCPCECNYGSHSAQRPWLSAFYRFGLWRRIECLIMRPLRCQSFFVSALQ